MGGKFAAERPDVLQRFIDASIEGWAIYMRGTERPLAHALIKRDNPDMADASIAYADQAMAERGLVLSGDAETLGIGAMTDARWERFAGAMVEAGVFSPGLDAPTAGRIDWPVAVHDAAGRPQRDVSFVFQEPTLMPWATAAGNVALPLRLAGVRRGEARARAMAALAPVDLAAFGAAYHRALSGGMRMRVSIARALVTAPRLLLMDEPFAALDEITRFRLNNDLVQLWEAERFTVVFVTHSVFESVYLARRVVVMAARPGRVSQCFDVEAPDGRGEGFRTSAACAGQCRAVSDGLARAMAA